MTASARAIAALFASFTCSALEPADERIEPLVARTYDVAVGEKVVVAGAEAGLVTYTSDGTSRLGVLPLPGSALRVALSGDVAWVALGPDGVAAVSVADPVSPRVIARIATTSSALGLAVSGAFVYVAEGSAGLAVFDASDPAAPRIAGRLLVGDYCRGVAVSGGTALVAASHGGLVTVDVRDPSNPRRLGLLQLGGPAQDAAFVPGGALALVAAGERGAFIVDVGSPAHPSARGTIASRDFVRGVAVRGSEAAIADGGGGVAFAAIEDADAPRVIRRAATKGQAIRVAFRADGKVLAAADASGLAIID